MALRCICKRLLRSECAEKVTRKFEGIDNQGVWAQANGLGDRRWTVVSLPRRYLGKHGRRRLSCAGSLNALCRHRRHFHRTMNFKGQAIILRSKHRY